MKVWSSVKIKPKLVDIMVLLFVYLIFPPLKSYQAIL